MATMQPHWDIFCRVIDNYGDIGVCWRLARQLTGEYGLKVRLWVDDLTALNMLCPVLNPHLAQQIFDEVDIRHWSATFPTAEAADVVIEAFACELPESYLKAMALRHSPPCWINLEYLSAEAWVEGCHGLASPHPTLPLTKHFFFPGFSAKTGGLIRESDLLKRRESLPTWPSQRKQLQTSLFCYETAPVAELLEAWANSSQPVRCLVPPGKPWTAVQNYFGSSGKLEKGSLEIEPICFVPQADFDKILWQCDLNFIRGEDSFVRAQWAAKPFIWQIYPQSDKAHLIKLEAFLDRYTETLPSPVSEATRKMLWAWNTGKELTAAWEFFLPCIPVLAHHGKAWSKKLASYGDLAGNLVKFCASRL